MLKTGIHIEKPIFNYAFILTKIKKLMAKIAVNKEDLNNQNFKTGKIHIVFGVLIVSLGL